jgi:hypothetical protein
VLCLAAAGPATKQSDPALDWMLSQATTAPATMRATTQPTSPLTDSGKKTARNGTITLSDGTKLVGEIATTAQKPLRVYQENEKEYVDLPFEQVTSIKALVVWERNEKEWQFKLSGSDEKVYSSRTYPARELQYTITTSDAKKVSGSIAAPIYLKQGDERRTLILHKRDKGDAGQTLKQLVYVQSVELDPK